ncbi:MAG: DNA repair protein RecO [Deltaproteobacteria bacterium]|nr:DNA repair protein RecO [Deltaproteobacteria bacterium]
MQKLTTEALVLRAVDLGESDRVVHLLTPETGRIAAIAKGARRSVKRFPGTLDFFNQLSISLERKRGVAQLARLEHAKLIRAFHGVRENAGRFALGCYVLELLDRLAPEGGRRGDLAALYRFALDALGAIDALPPTPRLRALLELRLLAAVGLRPELASCVRCGNAITTPRAQFWIAEGGAICERCTRPHEQGIPIHLGTLRALDQSLAFPLAHTGRIALGERALEEAQTVIGRFLRFHVGVELRSEAFVTAQLER